MVLLYVCGNNNSVPTATVYLYPMASRRQIWGEREIRFTILLREFSELIGTSRISFERTGRVLSYKCGVDGKIWRVRDVMILYVDRKLPFEYRNSTEKNQAIIMIFLEYFSQINLFSQSFGPLIGTQYTGSWVHQSDRNGDCMYGKAMTAFPCHFSCPVFICKIINTNRYYKQERLDYFFVVFVVNIGSETTEPLWNFFYY